MVAFCGFALFFTGFARAQNAIHTLIGVLLLYSVGLAGYWTIGAAVQGHGFAFLGFLTSASTIASTDALRLPFLAMVAAIAVVIPAGALAERWRLFSAMFVGGAVSTAIYPVVARSIWAGGGLAQLGVSRGLGHGVVDFAGSGVVHLVGGMVALAGAIVVGPRTGKFTHDGRPTAMPGHHVPMFMAGSLIAGAG